jgi:bifunctional oligoribonuclease and PAP phosphatase NrnA
MTPDPIPALTHDEVRAIFDSHHRFVLTTHVNPDGDAIGSEYALLHALRQKGKEVAVLNTSPLPENLSFLNADGAIRTYDDTRDAATIAEADVIIAVDLNDTARLKTMQDAVLASPARKMVIDHHLQAKPFAHGYCIDAEKCATAEILYDLLRPIDGAPLDRAVALGLYVGIMTDTGSFRFDRTTPRVHRIAAELLETGVDPVTVYRAVYDEYPLRRSRLLGMVLAGIRECCDGRATILTVTRGMFAETGTVIEDVENIVNYGLSIRGVEATALLTELDGEIKISLRSRGTVSIHAVAKALGGGGHMYASGATVTGRTVDEVCHVVMRAFDELLAGRENTPAS